MGEAAASDGRIVVAFDGSTDGERGLEWAIAYAQGRGCAIEVFSSSGDLEYLHERTAHNAIELVAGWEQEAIAMLAASGIPRAGEEAEAAGRGGWSTVTSDGKAAPELIDASRTASMVVLGARGHGRLGGMLLGSVSQHVTRHAQCPVVIVRGQRSPRSDRIVVGVDGSESGANALRFAFEHARDSGGCIVAVHGRAVSAMNGPFDVTPSPQVSLQMEIANKILTAALAPFREEFPDIQVESAPMPLPAVRALADASMGAKLVVVGTRGLGGFMGLLLGSVSSTVLQHAECPVAVVR